MKIYTKTGDGGETGLFGGERVSKNSIRIEAYGTIDELNAAIGVIRAGELPEKISEILIFIQNRLFNIGSRLASDEKGDSFTVQLLFNQP